MSQKRNPDDSTSEPNLEGNHTPDDKRRRSHRSFRSVVLEVMTQIRFERFQQALEPMLRKVVKEEVESAMKKHVTCLNWHCEEDVFPSESRSMQLKFLSKISLPVFTGTRIEGDDGSAIKVALVVACTNEVVQYAPESSAKVEVVVLEGEFDGDEGQNWTIEEFENNIVRERAGKKPLLTGDVFLFLKEGIGSVDGVFFTDNSSWTRSRRFRLGAQVVGSFGGARIREAKTESFSVKDHRGELYKKHHPPSLSDEVWRLEKIGKDGAFHKRLSIAKVNTVKDFLTLLHLYPAQLRSILGSGMSAKMWEVTVEHARTCVLGERIYLYYSPSSQHKNGVVFNMVGRVMGFYLESHYVPINDATMSETDKINAQEMVIEASRNWDGVISFEDLNSLLSVSPHTASSYGTVTADERKALTSTESDSFNYAELSMPSLDIPPSVYSLGCMSNLEDFSLQAVDNLDLRLDHPLESLLCEPDNVMRAVHDNDNEHLKFLDIDYSFQSTNPSLESHSHSSTHTIRRPACRRWRVLSSVVRWLMRGTDHKESQR